MWHIIKNFTYIILVYSLISPYGHLYNTDTSTSRQFTCSYRNPISSNLYLCDSDTSLCLLLERFDCIWSSLMSLRRTCKFSPAFPFLLQSLIINSRPNAKQKLFLAVPFSHLYFLQLDHTFLLQLFSCLELFSHTCHKTEAKVLRLDPKVLRTDPTIHIKKKNM